MKDIVAVEKITGKIYEIRGRKVMLDRDLAELYDVETKYLKQSVRRNMERFPSDFMFELSGYEFNNLRSQIATSSWGGVRYPPFAFTEQGVAMLSSVLRSKRAVQANIAIIQKCSTVEQALFYVRKTVEHNWSRSVLIHLLATEGMNLSTIYRRFQEIYH